MSSRWLLQESIRVCACVLSHFSQTQLFVTPWTVAHQASLSIGFSRQEYWRGLPCPPPGHCPDSGIESRSPKSPTLAGKFFTTSTTWEAWSTATAAAKSLQSCLTVCDPIDISPPGSPAPGILQERTLKWVAISFSKA